MNNVYNQRDYFNAGGNMCFDNKGMVATTPSDRPTSQPVRIDVTTTNSERNGPVQSTSSKITALRKRIRVPHVINSVVFVVVVSLLFFFEFGFWPETQLGFVCNDPQISHLYTGDTISLSLLASGSALLPLLVLLLTEYLRDGLRKTSMGQLWFFYTEFLVGVTLVIAITEIAKIVIGEHRPHFLDVCQPDANKFCVNGTYVAKYKCTSRVYSMYVVGDSSRSFPSGHSSISTFVSFFSAYLIQMRLPTAKTGQLLKPFLVGVCLTWAIVCSLSRITDRRHHWWDVLAGVVLGALGAYYSLNLVHKKLRKTSETPLVSASTTTLLDVKNKHAKSEII